MINTLNFPLPSSHFSVHNYTPVRGSQFPLRNLLISIILVLTINSQSAVRKAKGYTKALIDTKNSYILKTKIGFQTRLIFPELIEKVDLGNTNDFAIETEEASIGLKPTWGSASSNLHVKLATGDWITFRLIIVGRKSYFHEKVQFVYPNNNEENIKLDRIRRQFESKLILALEERTMKLKASIPDETLNSTFAYRISGSRGKTSVKNHGAIIQLSHVISTTRKTYFHFITNLENIDKTKLLKIEKIESKNKKNGRTYHNFKVTYKDNRIIATCPLIALWNQNIQKTKLFITTSIYNEKEMLKATIY